MKEEKFFSVILNTYNDQRTIARTLCSILKQSYKNFDLIIVDDCSTDKTLSIIKNLLLNNSEIPVKILALKENNGIANARNIGIKEATGNYVAFIDGDDVWRENKLKVQFNFIKKEKANWVFSNYSVIDSDYKYIGERKRQAGVYDYKKIISRGNPVGLLTVAVKTNLAKKNYFRNVKHEDYDLWIRLAKNGVRGFLIPESLASYMKHSNSVSSNKFLSLKWTYQIFRINKISRISASFLTFRYITNYFLRKSN